MNLRLLCGAIIFVVTICSWNVGAEKILLCYYDAKAIDISGDGRFMMDDINPHLCTHLVYHKVELDIETKKTKVKLQFESDIKKIVKLKQKNPHLKVLIDLVIQQDLWYETQLVEFMTNSSHVDGLIETVLDFLRLYQFNGIFLRFYPNRKTKVGFMNLISEMKKAFRPHSHLFAIIVIDKDKSIINEGYNIPILNRDVDLLTLWVNDFHDPAIEPDMADHHSPLYERPWDKENKNVDFVVNHWINKGLLPNKILLGIALYGNSWTLSSNKIIPPAPAFGPGPPAKYSEENGYMSYFEICQAVKSEGWQIFQNPNKTMGPYAVSQAGQNRTWVGYDDPAMAVIKSKYILSKGLGGAAVWDVSQDDFHNKCGDGHNPLLNAIYNTLNLEGKFQTLIKCLISYAKEMVNY